jgi:hypothetical protein
VFSTLILTVGPLMRLTLSLFAFSATPFLLSPSPAEKYIS